MSRRVPIALGGAGLSALAVAAALSSSLSGCRLLGGDDDAPESGAASALEKPALKISLMTTSDLAPFWLAVEKGYFRHAGFRFDPVKDVILSKSGGDSVSRLVAREVDIAYASYVPFFVAKRKGVADIRLVADASSAGPGSCAVMAAPGSSIKRIEDMPGKRVAVTARHTISDLMVMATLKARGVDWESIQWVEVPFPQMADRLARGDVDAAFLTEPFKSQAARQIGAVVVFDAAAGPTADLPTSGFGATAEFIQKNPKTLAAWQAVMQRATDEARADRSKVEPLLQKYSKIDAETAKQATFLTFQSSLDAAKIQRVPDLMVAFGMIDQTVDVAPMIARAPRSP